MRRTSVGADGAERLARIPLFEDFSRGERRMLARAADQAFAAAGETLMEEGEPAYELMVLEAGSAEVLHDSRRVAALGPGDIFGELAVLAGGARRARVRATRDVRTLVFTAHFAHEMRARVPRLRERIDRTASRRLAEAAPREEGRAPAARA
ncbi:MAG TPA: cyclic nucleotide-binding domain-containing protein [Solirubrobacteraceae bacterium]|jgi:CRP-like cAMP-binding protein|nr:cyclic nucleotide-binding domain-containing protein [Solirubrobacteraceae bacterium]